MVPLASLEVFLQAASLHFAFVLPSLWQIDLLKIQVVEDRMVGVPSPTGVAYPPPLLIPLLSPDRQKALAVGNAEGGALEEYSDSKPQTREGSSSSHTWLSGLRECH